MVSIGKVLLAVFGVALVVILIAVPTALYLTDHTDMRRPFSLGDYFNDSLNPKSYPIKWISDEEYLYEKEGVVFRHNARTGDVDNFLNLTQFSEHDIVDYVLSGDQNYVAFIVNYTKQWRHSFNSSYIIYDLVNKELIGDAGIPHDVQLLDWAPEGSKLAYVWGNDLYLKSNISSPSQKVTSNGKHNQLLNGVPDWVYEEEMFGSNEGMWWSQGGKYLAYIESNESDVHTIEYSWYGDEQYPSTVVIPYPKPGTQNAVVKLFVVDSDDTTKVMPIVIPSNFSNGDHYLATVTWVTWQRMAVQWLKRKQDHLLLQIYDFNGESWEPVEALEVKQPKGWVGRFSPDEPVFAPNNSSYYLVMSDSQGYKHIHRVDNGNHTSPVTSGKWEVISILKVTDDDIVYFTSNEYEGRAGGRNLYKWTPKGKECLTCKLAPDCLYNVAYFSHNASYYRTSCLGPGIPRYSLCHNNGTEIKVLENNEQYANLISNIKMPWVEEGTIQMEGYDIKYQLVFPPDFSKSKKYPLLVDVYAGPCSQVVTSTYSVDWSSYLASTENIIVAGFDGRGSGYRGDELLYAIYRQLGTFEVDDQITAVKEITKRGYIDEKRIAIWGWSYGGYVASMALGAGSGVFKCGIAVAPVSKWEYYDSIYTERYMNEPRDNQKAYEDSTVTARAKNFSSVQYLLVHGTADDNVHFQQAAQISKALVEAEVEFEAMWYTDMDHGLYSPAHEHLYTQMSHFLLRCFA